MGIRWPGPAPISTDDAAVPACRPPGYYYSFVPKLKKGGPGGRSPPGLKQMKIFYLWEPYRVCRPRSQKRQTVHRYLSNSGFIRNVI